MIWTERSSDATGESGRQRRTIRILRYTTLAATIATAAWVIAAGAMANRGFDLTDEGSYLLSYRWWRVDTRTFTGAQYLYGPIFESLKYNIAALRLFGLISVVIVHAVFGWAFMAWLRTQRPTAPRTRWWDLAGISSIVASGGVAYGWLAPTPGYNTLALLGAMLLASLVLRIAIQAQGSTKFKPAVAILVGPPLVAVLLGRWSAAFALLVLLTVVCLAMLKPIGFRQSSLFLVWSVVGVVISIVVFNLAVIPLSEALPPFIAVTHLESSGGFSSTDLLKMYARTTMSLLLVSILIAAPCVICIVGSMRISSGRASRFLSIAGLTVSVMIVYVIDGWRGGVDHLWNYTASLVGLALIVGAAYLTAAFHPQEPRSIAPSLPIQRRAILTLLVLLPAFQGIGTSNPIFTLAVNCFASWVALLIFALTGVNHSSLRRIAAIATFVAVFLAVSVGVDGSLLDPYRTGGFSASSEQATLFPALASLRLPQRELARLTSLQSSLPPNMHTSGRPILALDELAGAVLALGGRPVGETWLSAADDQRAAAGIRAACVDGNPWDGQQPILLVNRKLTRDDIDALRSCGQIFPTGYREIRVTGWPGLSVFIPNRIQ